MISLLRSLLSRSHAPHAALATVCLGVLSPTSAAAQVDDCTVNWCWRGEVSRSLRPDVAWAPGGNLGLAVWEDPETAEVWYRTFDEGGYRTRPPVLLASEAGRPRVAARDDGFFVVFEDYAHGPGTRVIRGQLLPLGNLTCSGWFCSPWPRSIAISEPGAVEEIRPEVQPMADGERFAVAWTSLRDLPGPAPHPDGHFMMRLVDPPVTHQLCWPGPCSYLEPTGGDQVHRTGSRPVLGDVGDGLMWAAYAEPAASWPSLTFATLDEVSVRGWSDILFEDVDRRVDHVLDVTWTPSAQSLAAVIEPRVAAGPATSALAEHLMVWEEARPVPIEDDQSVYGTCLDVAIATGDVDSPSGFFEIAYHPHQAKTRPHAVHVAGESKYLVVWADEERPAELFWAWSNVRASYVDCQGSTPVVGPSFWVSKTFDFSMLPRVASNGASAYVVYEEARSSGARVILRKVTGTAVGPTLYLD